MIAKTEANDFPPVELNTTLYDLLNADQPEGEPIESLCKLKPNSDVSMGTAVPLSDKYIIHCAQIDNGDDLAHLQLEICSYLLMFFAGPMDVIFLAAEGETDEPTLVKDTVHKNATRSFSVIKESQRPKIKTYANVEDAVANHDGSKIRWGFAMDIAERMPYLLHPDIVYLLNSKRWLGVNDTLKSANDNVIDCQIKCADHQHKTSQHKQQWYYGGRDCEKCAAGVEAEIRRIHDIIQKRQPPFVLKLTQSLSAVGTNIVKDEKEKAELLEKISEYLNDYLPRINKKNAHLYTTSLILSDHLDGETVALNLHVNRDGSIVYLGACNQLGTGESGRQNTAIIYADQDKHEAKYRKVLEKIGLALHEEGYWGPVGADVMEDKDGNLNTIDLNVRTPLSLVLYLLRGHFHEKRGYGVALVYECLQLRISREELEEKFRKEFEEARIVLMGGTRFGEKNQWAYGIILAGEEKKDVDRLSDRILEFEI